MTTTIAMNRLTRAFEDKWDYGYRKRHHTHRKSRRTYDSDPDFLNSEASKDKRREKRDFDAYMDRNEDR